MNIAIISTPRTGSSILQDAISQHFNIANLNEIGPVGSKLSRSVIASVDTLKNHKNFSAKFMVGKLTKEDMLLVNFDYFDYIFYTYRSKIIDQIVSLQISESKNSWGITPEITESLQVDPQKMSYISKVNKAAHEIKSMLCRYRIFSVDFSRPETSIDKISSVIDFGANNFNEIYYKLLSQKPIIDYPKFVLNYNNFARASSYYESHD